MDPARFEPLAELAVHGANVQPGQVGARERRARARAARARGRRRGLRPRREVRRRRLLRPARQAGADRARRSRDARLRARRGTGGGCSRTPTSGARASRSTGADRPEPARRARPGARRARPAAVPQARSPKIVGERTTNWCIVPCPHPAWAKLVYPELSDDAALERLWQRAGARPASGRAGPGRRPGRSG